MKQTIELSIQEICNDFYKLAYEEGFYAGTLEEFNGYDADRAEEYFDKMLDLIKKYIPTYEKHLNHKFYDEDLMLDEKGLMLSQMLEENFKEIICNLI